MPSRPYGESTLQMLLTNVRVRAPCAYFIRPKKLAKKQPQNKDNVDRPFGHAIAAQHRYKTRDKALVLTMGCVAAVPLKVLSVATSHASPSTQSQTLGRTPCITSSTNTAEQSRMSTTGRNKNLGTNNCIRIDILDFFAPAA